MPLNPRTLCLFFALAACRASTDLATERQYPCSPDAGEGRAQCPEASRCGLDGRCHLRAVASDYVCNTDDDCEQGWRCGAGKRCHDRVPAAYACESDLDCEGGWRCACCGPQRVCHPRDTGAAYPCRSHDDCEQGWHCGLEGLCHDPAVGAAYTCMQDSHCEAGWRCGLEERCVDGTPELLRPGLFTGALDERRLNPPLGGLPLEVSASQPGELRSDGGPELQSFAWLIGDRVEQLAVIFAADGGQAGVSFSSLALDAGAARGLVAAGGRAFFADARGLCELEGGVVRVLGGGPGIRELRGTPFGWDELLLVARYDDAVSVYSDRRGLLGPFPVPRADGGAQPLFDAVMGETYNTGPYRLLVAAEEGLFVAPYANGVFYGPLAPTETPEAPNMGCGPHADAGAPMQVTRLDSSAGGMVVMAGSSAGRSHVAWLQWTGTEATGCAAAPPVHHGACPACPAGDALAGVTMAGGTNGVLAFCRSVNQQVRALVVALDTCATTEPYYPLPRWSPAVVGRGRQGHVTLADHAGRVADIELGKTVTRAVLDSAPRVLFRLGGRRWVTGGNVQDGFFYAFEEPGVGFVRSPLAAVDPPEASELSGVHTLLPEQAVEGALDWVLTGAFSSTTGRVYDLTTGAVRLAATYDVNAGVPRHAVFAPTPDAGHVLLAAFEDRLMAADVAGVNVARLEVKLAPKVFDPIRSLAAVRPSAPADGGEPPLVAGYVLTGTALFLVEAQSLARWRSRQLVVPPRAIAVWSDGAAGRLGYRDGTVLSLPSRIRLSQPLPDAGVLAYAAPCGQPFALTAGALYRLQPEPDAGIARWEREPLPTLLDPAEPGFEGGRLDVDGDELLLSTATGNVIALRPPLSCPGVSP